MREILASIAEKQDEARFLREVLQLWDVCPYAPEDVKNFSFRPEFLTKEELEKAGTTYRISGPLWRERNGKYNSRTHINCVRLHTDELKPMPLHPRPIR